MSTTAPLTEQVMTLASGHQLRYATRGADQPIAVVFVHGWPDSWRSFEPVLDALPPTVGAISVSLRGFGGSDAPADGLHTRRFRCRRRRARRSPRRQVGGVRRALDGHSRRPAAGRIASRHGGWPRPDRRPPRASRRGVRGGVVGRAGSRRSDQRGVRPRVPVEHPRRARPGSLLRPARRREPSGARPCLASGVRRSPHHAP